MPKNTLWFTAKRYGWGWTPATWQGWLTILIFAAGVTYFTALGLSTAQTTGDIIVNMIVPITLMCMLLVMFCYEKGETPRWQWGRRR